MKSISKDDIKFCVLFTYFTAEPFFILASFIEWDIENLLESFIEALAELVDSGKMNIYQYAEGPVVDCKGSTYNTLKDYTDLRLKNGDSLTELSTVYDDYEFKITAEGEDYICEILDSVEKRCMKIVSLIEQFKADKGILPENLFELFSAYNEYVNQPIEAAGCWWYRTDASKKDYTFGFLVLTGELLLYDQIAKKWYKRGD